MGAEKATKASPTVEPPATVRATFEVKEMSMEEVAPVEATLGYKFNNPSLVSEALTHTSYYPRYIRAGPTYERLEFVGDAVLNLLVAREVYTAYPQLKSGNLTLLRAANVDTEKFARIAVNHHLHRHLRHRAPKLQSQVQQFKESIIQYPYHSNGLLDPPKFLADIVESLIGAVFLDSKYSLETTWKIFRGIAEPMINLNTLGKHPVTELHEFCQKRKMKLRFVTDTWKESTMVKVLIDDNMAGSATYAKKKEIALNRAAKDALDRLKKESAELELAALSLTD